MRALDEIAPPALALLEYDGVPAGVAAADRMLKRAPVSLIRAGTVQPGRFLVLLGGSVAAVEESYAERGAPLDAILLPDAHPALAPALAGERAAAQSAAIGLLEGATSASLLAAADVVLKTTPVGIVELRLADGTRVVLKIQRPGIHPKIESDVNILHTTAGYLEEAFSEAHIMDLRGMVRDFARSLSQELDYTVEANNMERFRRNFADSEDIHIPTVFKELSTSAVLTMEFIEGKKFEQVIAEGSAPDELVRRYFNVAYKMLFIDGFFHGDLHPGNVLLTSDGRLGLLDCGMVGRLAPSRKDKVVDIIHAVINEDLELLARTFFQLAIPQGPVDYPAFEQDAIAIAEQYLIGVPLSQIEIGVLFQQLVDGASRHAVRMPTDFTMMFKAILTTEGLAKAIAPDVDPIELARPYITQMVTERDSPERLKSQAIRDLIAFSGMARHIPNSLPMLLDDLHAGKLKLGVNDESLALQHKAADLRVGRAIRAALSIALLACGTVVIGVAGLPVAIWGIPWLSIVFWGLALLLNATLLRRKGILPAE